jgi:hypothetical protein
VVDSRATAPGAENRVDRPGRNNHVRLSTGHHLVRGRLSATAPRPIAPAIETPTNLGLTNRLGRWHGADGWSIGAAVPTPAFWNSPFSRVHYGPTRTLAVNDRLQVVPDFTNIYVPGDIQSCITLNSNEVKLGQSAEAIGAFIAESFIAQIVHNHGGGGETSAEQPAHVSALYRRQCGHAVYLMLAGQVRWHGWFQ